MIAVFGVIAIGVVAISVTVVIVEKNGQSIPARLSTSSTQATPSTDAVPGKPPDLSTMTPRQAADRLFNRIMAALERGDAAEAERFAPMALQAYQRIDALDADAHFHIARIHLAVGDVDGVRREVEAIKRLAPKHLFGFTLEHTVAGLAGDTDGMVRAYTGFMDAFESEISSGRPEYDGHRTHIDQFRSTKGRTAVASADPARVSSGEAGSRLFVKHCASCHGLKAEGSQEGAKKGPPLVHRLYAPNHHADAAFVRAIRQGARAHHWSFGNMPPVPGVSDSEVRQIITHIRGLQRAGGIE